MVQVVRALSNVAAERYSVHCPSSCCQIPYPPLLQERYKTRPCCLPICILVGMFLWYSIIFDVLCKGYAKPLFCSHDLQFGPWCNLVQPIGGSKLSRLQQSLLWATAHLTQCTLTHLLLSSQPSQEPFITWQSWGR